MENRSIKVEGPTLFVDQVLPSGRIYMHDAVMKAVEEFNSREDNRWFTCAEIGHCPAEGPTTSLSSIVGNIGTLTLEGERLMVTGEIFNKDLLAILEYQDCLGVGIKGSGTVNEAGEVEDFVINSVGITPTPSDRRCMITLVKEEN